MNDMWLIELAAKVTAWLLLGYALAILLRWRHPKWRVVWLRTVVIGVLVLPILIVQVPRAAVIPSSWATESKVSTIFPAPPTIQQSSSLTQQAIRSVEGGAAQVSRNSEKKWMMIGISIWLLGAVIYIGRLGVAFSLMRGLVRRSAPLPSSLTKIGRDIAHDMGLRRRTSFRRSSEVGAPLLTGIFEIVIVLPNDLFTDKHEANWRAVFAHELAHVKGHDGTWRLLFQLVTALWWVYPLMWPLLRWHDRATEELADATAASLTNDIVIYKQTLSTVALKAYAWYVGTSALPMGRPGSVLDRLGRLPENLKRRVMRRPATVATIGFGMGIVGIGAALGLTSEKWPIQHASAPLIVRCIDEDGKAVSGAQVYLVEMHGRGRHDINETIPYSRQGPLTSGPDGLVELPNPVTFDHGQYFRSIFAILPGHSAGGTYYDSGNPVQDQQGPVNLLMMPSITLEGQVNGLGEHAQEGKVRLLIWRSDDTRYVVGSPFYGLGAVEPWPEVFIHSLDANGKFEFLNIPAGFWVHLEISAPGFGTTQIVHKMASHQAGVSRVDAPLMEREAILIGQVKDRDTGIPLAEKEIVVRPRNVGVIMPQKLQTDAQGRFKLGGLRGGSYVVETPNNSAYVTTPESVTLRAGESHDMSITACPGVLIEGSVNGDVGEDEKFSVVATSDAIPGLMLATAKIKRDGSYTMRLPDGRAKLYLTSLISDEHILEIRDGQLISGNPNFKARKYAGPELTQKSVARIEGIVLHEDGTPAKGIQIALTTISNFALTKKVTKTNEDGWYGIDVKSPALYVVIAGGVTESVAKSKVVSTTEAGLFRIEDLTVRMADGRASGQVLDAEGKPLPNAELTTRSKNKYGAEAVLTDADGRFHVDHILKNEPFSLTITKPGYTSQTLETLSPGNDGIKVVLKPAS